ncbi:PTS fructose transporter subunit IIB [Pelosinus sp. UFO1]|uniref:PTS fructose transporter subunit IIB n=1 Tax=Pelosinus sp. UFO1 TaxID=484770 RepID=UPI0004D16ECA|nr:fructose PTS transporter subunit IIB [Pelosinus sp. UFO1]AIF50954.1 PTS system, fructose-specific, IIB subunnit [Pelosinus sp. UFO1]
MKIVAVTACPVGIAHTYMAAAALQKAAVNLGHTMKVETQGSIGIENKITQKEVDEADLVILAADVAVKEEMRFKNKFIYKTESQKAIKNPKGLITEALVQFNEK